MKRILVLLLAVLLTACGSIPDVRNEYQGPDAGRVAIGIGATVPTRYSSYSLVFRKVGEKDAPANRFVYFQDNSFSAQKRDYDNAAENGVVQSFRLPPGDYEIFNFDIFLNQGTVQKNFGSRQAFSIPFTVRPNETTYLGNYQANLITGKNIFGLTLPAGAVFVVSDRAQADVALAQKRLPAVQFGTITNATPKPASLGNPFFVDEAQRPAAQK
jgi:hypothetical protein